MENVTDLLNQDFTPLFAIVPVFDWAAIGQRIIAFLQRFVVGVLIVGIGRTLINIVTKPLALVAIVSILSYCPDTVQWCFEKIGSIFLTIFVKLLGLFMPSIIGQMSDGSGDIIKTANDALSFLPQNIIDVLTSFGLSELLGMVVTCLLLGWIIKTTRQCMMRAGGM